MELEGRRKARRAPNLTPLIDVVFLLLVFFMLTAHFVREETVEIALPDAESSAARDVDDPLEVIIDPQGRLLYGGSAAGPQELEKMLRRALGARGEKVVTLRGDKRASLDATVSALDAARKAGADSVDIVTIRQPE
ncbi:MAG: ExbD/TolR family protein [Candidatus Nitrospinota bacterium M3_3B_026]